MSSEVVLNLRDDLPDVGHVIAGKVLHRVFSPEHVQDILDCLEKKIADAKAETVQQLFDVVIFGIMPVEIGMMLAANLVCWDDVRSLWYAHPRGATMKIFPM